MGVATTEPFPESELTYWTTGTESAPPVTLATAPAIWQEYLLCHKEGNWHQALIAVNRLIEHDPQQPELWRVKAKLHGFLGHSTSCMAAIQRLLQIEPNDLDGLRMQALFHYCHNSPEHALSICDSVLCNNPSQADFWALKGDILYSNGKPIEAEKACKRALQAKPDCLSALRLQKNLQKAV